MRAPGSVPTRACTGWYGHSFDTQQLQHRGTYCSGRPRWSIRRCLLIDFRPLANTTASIIAHASTVCAARLCRACSGGIWSGLCETDEPERVRSSRSRTSYIYITSGLTSLQGHIHQSGVQKVQWEDFSPKAREWVCELIEASKSHFPDYQIAFASWSMNVANAQHVRTVSDY